MIDEAAVEVVAAPRPVRESRPAPRSEDRQPRSEGSRSDGNRNDGNRTDGNRTDTGRSDNSRSRGSQSGGDRNVLGLGDHVPDFILRSFRVKESAADPVEDETTQEA